MYPSSSRRIRFGSLVHPWRSRFTGPVLDSIHLRSRCPGTVVLGLHARGTTTLVGGWRGIGARSARAGALLALLELHGWGLHLSWRRTTTDVWRSREVHVGSGRTLSHLELAETGSSWVLLAGLPVHSRSLVDVGRHVLLEGCVRPHTRVRMAVTKEGVHLAHYFHNLSAFLAPHGPWSRKTGVLTSRN